MNRYRFICMLAGVILSGAMSGPVSALDIQYDYSLDSNGFFSGSAGPARRATMERAAADFEAILLDNLSAITPSGGNTWTLKITHPGTGNEATFANPSIPANVVPIYIGGRSISGSTLGIGGGNGFSAGGNQAWFNIIRARGQAGALTSPATDVSVAAGHVSFDSDPDRVWHADPDSPAPLGSIDLYSVALHELGHVFGIGTVTSWNALCQGGVFIGPRASRLHGANPGLHSDNSHWANGIMSVTFADPTQSQEAAMDPSITANSRKTLTILDAMGLQDIGWTLPAGSLRWTGTGSLTVSESTNLVGLTLLRRGGYSGTIAVQVDTISGTAISGNDMLAINSQLVSWNDTDFSPRSVQLTVLDDGLSEPSESFGVQLSNPTNQAALGNPSLMTMTILDNEPPGNAAPQITQPADSANSINLP